jgi:hypothetical protein
MRDLRFTVLLALGTVLGCQSEFEDSCTAGEEACECTNTGACLSGLECVAGTCSQPGDGDGDGDGTGGDGDGDGDGDGACQGDEMTCDGECVDIMTRDDHCGECDHECQVTGPAGYERGKCVDGQCTPRWVCAPPSPEVDCTTACQVNAASSCGECDPGGVYAIQLEGQSCIGAIHQEPYTVFENGACSDTLSIPVTDSLFCCCEQE